jgi:hypothetical protein
MVPALAAMSGIVSSRGRFKPGRAGYDRDMLRCRLLGHRFRFRAEGATMRWECVRCAAGSAKEYASAADAARYARVFDREDRDTVGRRTPIGLLPLLLVRKLRRRRS